MADESSINETVDPSGTRVVLTDAVWSGKVVLDHREIAAYRVEVLRTVATPDHVVPDPNFERRTRYYARDVDRAAGCWWS